MNFNTVRIWLASFNKDHPKTTPEWLYSSLFHYSNHTWGVQLPNHHEGLYEVTAQQKLINDSKVNDLTLNVKTQVFDKVKHGTQYWYEFNSLNRHTKLYLKNFDTNEVHVADLFTVLSMMRVSGVGLDARWFDSFFKDVVGCLLFNHSEFGGLSVKEHSKCCELVFGKLYRKCCLLFKADSIDLLIDDNLIFSQPVETSFVLNLNETHFPECKIKVGWMARLRYRLKL